MVADALKLLVVAALAGTLAGALAGADARAQGTVRVTEEPAVSQPPPFSTRGQTVVVPRTRIEIDEGRGTKTLSGVPLRRKPTPEPAAAPATGPQAAPDAPACTHSKILCGDPLKRRQPKSQEEIEADAAPDAPKGAPSLDGARGARDSPACTHSKILCGDPLRRKK